ncbi:MAG: hypothetical protein AAF492_19445, partial [Verrucomicrobiota bacterium]
MLSLKILVALALVLLGNLVAPDLARWIWSDTSLTIYMRLLFFAVGGQLLWKYISSTLSTHQQFGRLAGFLTTMPVLMLGAVLVLILLDRFHLHSALLVYLLAPVTTALLWWFNLDLTFLKNRTRDRTLLKKLLGFSRWVYLSDIASVTRNHGNTILLKNAAFSGSQAVGNLNAGIYSFGAGLANELSMVAQSLMTVLLPKASKKLTVPELKSYLKKSYRNMVWLMLVLLSFMFLAKPGIHLLGLIKASYLDYLDAVPVFMLLYLGLLFSIMSIPMTTALYALQRPQAESI